MGCKGSKAYKVALEQAKRKLEESQSECKVYKMALEELRTEVRVLNGALELAERKLEEPAPSPHAAAPIPCTPSTYLPLSPNEAETSMGRDCWLITPHDLVVYHSARKELLTLDVISTEQGHGCEVSLTFGQEREEGSPQIVTQQNNNSLCQNSTR